MQAARRGLAAAVLFVFTLYEASAARSWASRPGDDAVALVFAFFTVLVALACVGVVLRSPTARWLALGIGVAGLIDVATMMAMGAYHPAVFLFAGLPVGVIVLLAGRSMAEHFAAHEPGSKASPQQLRRTAEGVYWLRRDGRFRVANLAIVLVVPLVAGLTRYAAADAPWIGDEDRAVALLASASAVVGGLWMIRGRTAGLLVLAASALGSAVLMAESALALRIPSCQMLSRLDGRLVELAMPSTTIGLVGALLALAMFVPGMVRFWRTAWLRGV